MYPYAIMAVTETYWGCVTRRSQVGLVQCLGFRVRFPGERALC